MYDKDIEDSLEEAKIAHNPMGSEFDLEVWLSSDGKHTVKIFAKTERGKIDGLKVGKAIYEGIISSYGTKQAQSAREYSSGNNKPIQGNSEAQKIDPDTCSHPNAKEFTVKKEGKNQGRRFTKCDACGFFNWLS